MFTYSPGGHSGYVHSKFALCKLLSAKWFTRWIFLSGERYLNLDSFRCLLFFLFFFVDLLFFLTTRLAEASVVSLLTTAPSKKPRRQKKTKEQKKIKNILNASKFKNRFLGTSVKNAIEIWQNIQGANEYEAGGAVFWTSRSHTWRGAQCVHGAAIRPDHTSCLLVLRRNNHFRFSEGATKKPKNTATCNKIPSYKYHYLLANKNNKNIPNH